MLEKIDTYDTRFLDVGTVEIRRITVIMEDGVEISQVLPHRWGKTIGDNIDDLPSDIQAIISLRWLQMIKANNSLMPDFEIESFNSKIDLWIANVNSVLQDTDKAKK